MIAEPPNGPPINFDGDEYVSVMPRFQTGDFGPEVVTKWRFTPSELALLAAGAPFYLAMYGNEFPNVRMQVGETPDAPLWSISDQDLEREIARRGLTRPEHKSQTPRDFQIDTSEAVKSDYLEIESGARDHRVIYALPDSQLSGVGIWKSTKDQSLEMEYAVAYYQAGTDLARAYVAQNAEILRLRSLASPRPPGAGLPPAATGPSKGLTLPFDGDPCSCELCGEAEATIWLVGRKSAICADCCARELEAMLQGVCQREAATTIRQEAKLEACRSAIGVIDEYLDKGLIEQARNVSRAALRRNAREEDPPATLT